MRRSTGARHPLAMVSDTSAAAYACKCLEIQAPGHGYKSFELITSIVFRVPQTHSFMHTMTQTAHKSTLTRLTLLTLVAQPLIFYLLWNHPTIRSAFFLLYFAFWRGAYDWGFAWLLRKQSEKKWIVRSLRSWGWLDVHSTQGGEAGRAWAKWWKKELEMKMSTGYKWEDVPQEFNSWLIFRQLVDLVLLK